MNLNDPQTYKIIIFKRTIFYSLQENILLRDVFYRFTKDGVKPNLGIQEIFLLTDSSYQEVMKRSPNLTRSMVKNKAEHSFSIKGYFRNKQA